jgi:HEAT repeat protein/tRNA A-37 threonylcarbamoyl transferase component Bud32
MHAHSEEPTLVGPAGDIDTLPPDPRVGALFGNFRVLRKIGEGGMGVVYEAEHQQIGRRAAIKLLHRHLVTDAQYAKRFLNEARAVNIIRHRGLVEIFEYGQLPDGTLYFVMEFLEGETLRRRIGKRGSAFAVEEAVGLLLQVARTLAAAHEKGIIHRDLKPENIMLVPEPVHPGLDWVKILDFGIAKVHSGGLSSGGPESLMLRTRIGSVMGTPHYMAPEQYGGAERVDGKADVFSLGVMLYEVLAGGLPFEDDALSLFGHAPVPLDRHNGAVPPRLAALVQRMLSTHPEERPAMAEVVHVLAALQPTSGRRRLRRWLAFMAGAGGVLGVALLLWTLRPQAPTAAEIREHARKVLSTSLRSEVPEVRVLAARAVGQSRDLEQRALLEPLLRAPGQPPQVVAEAASALGKIGAVAAQPALIELLRDHPDPGVQVAAAGALIQLHHPRGTEALKQKLAEPGHADGAAQREVHKMHAALLLIERGDPSGAALVWTGLDRGALAEEARVQVLGKLALSGDPRARRLLTQTLLEGTGMSEARAYAAFNLARLGEDSGRALLRSAVGGTGAARPIGLLAMRLLAALGEPIAQEPLRQLVATRSEPDAARELGMLGLADGGKQDSLRLLDTVMSERGASPRLRIAAAGAILQIATGERGQLAEQSLSWARSALSSDSVTARELAVAALADMDADPIADKTIEPLGWALKDPDRAVRKSAASALGRKRARAALTALAESLDDADPEVRTIGMQSIAKVVSVLKAAGDRGADRLILARLTEQARGGSALDRVVASGVLHKLGVPGQREVLREGLRSEDAKVRQLAVELTDLDEDGELIKSALTDPELAVRFAAARRLASAGSHRDAAAAVLREVAARGDRDGLLAYEQLRQQGESPPPPPGLDGLLSSADLPTRFAVIRSLPELPPPHDEAARLLQLALIDPAAVIRKSAAEAASELYRRTGQPRFFQMVRSLINDPDVIVRARVASLCAELTAFIPPPPAPVRSGAAPAVRPEQAVSAQDAATAAVDAAAPVTGQILLLGDELVRFRIDDSPPQPLTREPLPIAPGRHRISYLGGSREVRVEAGQTLRVRVPVTLAEQLLSDSQEAFALKELSRAQERLDRARRLQQRGKLGPALQAELAYQQGRLYEARGRLREALTEYNRCLGVSAGQRRPELNAQLRDTLDRLAGQVGRIQIFTASGGTCGLSQELLLLPGEQVISIGRNRTRTVFSQLGSTNKVMACQ